MDETSNPKNARTRKENMVLRLPVSKLPTRSLKRQFFYYFVNDTCL